jgi:hypothetical protein
MHGGRSRVVALGLLSRLDAVADRASVDEPDTPAMTPPTKFHAA